MVTISGVLRGALAAAVAVSSVAAQGTAPASLELDAGATVPLVAQARRAHQLGSIDLYSVAIYANASVRDPAILASKDVAKAVRIEITYQVDLQRGMTFDWQRELIPAVDPAGMALMRRIIAPMRAGDVLQMDYTREKGTTVRVNKDVAVSRASHDLILAFLDHWIGQRPMSEEIKRALLREHISQLLVPMATDLTDHTDFKWKSTSSGSSV